MEKDPFSIEKNLQDAVTGAKMGTCEAATKKTGLDFPGEDAAAVRAIRELFETWFKSKGHETDTRDYEIEISGAVRLEKERMRLQMPYADQSLTLVSYPTNQEGGLSMKKIKVFAMAFAAVLLMVSLGCGGREVRQVEPPVSPSLSERLDQLYKNDPLQWENTMRQLIAGEDPQIPQRHLVAALKEFNDVRTKKECLKAAYLYLDKEASAGGDLCARRQAAVFHLCGVHPEAPGRRLHEQCQKPVPKSPG